MTHIIYIPGFGTKSDPARRSALRRWKGSNTHVTFVPMRWDDTGETYEQKYERVAEAIAHAKSDKIVLVGESAGGAMALLTFSRVSDRVDQVFTVCGYNHGAADVHLVHKTRRPAFYAMMPEVDRAVAQLTGQQRQHITTLYSKSDITVTPSHSLIPGSKAIILKTPGHFISIASVLISNKLRRHIHS